MFYKIRSLIIWLPLPCLWSQKCPHHHPELKILWLTSFQHHTVITICIYSSRELYGVSCHNLLFDLVLLSHSGVHCHLSNLDPGTPLHCRAVNGSRVLSWRSQKFASILTICTESTLILSWSNWAHRWPCTPNSSARAFNLLTFALNPEEEVA